MSSSDTSCCAKLFAKVFISERELKSGDEAAADVYFQCASVHREISMPDSASDHERVRGDAPCSHQAQYNNKIMVIQNRIEV